MTADSPTTHYHIEPLGPAHDRMAFSCGVESLDRYLKQQAMQDFRKSAAAPFVLLELASNIVRGYYTLSMTGIRLAHLPDSVARKLPRYPVTPATLLGRLAVDQSCRGRGAGALLIADALKRALWSEIAWVAVVVDAIDDRARAFYEHHGFIVFPDQSRRLFILKRTVEQMFRT